MSRADQAADLLAELMHGNDRAEVAGALGDALDAYALARLAAVARTRLGALTAARVRADAIRAGYTSYVADRIVAYVEEASHSSIGRSLFASLFKPDSKEIQMSFSITINGHTAAKSEEVEAIAHDAVRKLKALPGAQNITLTGWCNEGGNNVSITLKNPPDEAAVESA
jgi:hypothetical protein